MDKKPMWKTVSFWVALVLTNLSLLLANNVIADGQIAQAMGWLLTIATVFGYKALPAAPAADAPTA